MERSIRLSKVESVHAEKTSLKRSIDDKERCIKSQRVVEKKCQKDWKGLLLEIANKHMSTGKCECFERKKRCLLDTKLNIYIYIYIYIPGAPKLVTLKPIKGLKYQSYIKFKAIFQIFGVFCTRLSLKNIIIGQVTVMEWNFKKAMQNTKTRIF